MFVRVRFPSRAQYPERMAEVRNISHIWRALALSLFLLFSLRAAGQYFEQPVSWRGSVEKVGDNLYELRFVANMGPEWHIYDMEEYAGGPNPTTLSLELPNGAETADAPRITSEVSKSYDDAFRMEVGVCHAPVTIVQRVEVPDGGNIIATLEWQACNATNYCLPPADQTITLSIAASEGAAAAADAAPGAEASAAAPEAFAGEETAGSLWSVILEAIAWGFVALLTPCVFPMVPMTVSFFLKNSGGKRRGRFMAMLYGLSIIALYTLPIAIIIVITYFVGGDAVTADIFNWLATHWIPNLIFFAIFMIFAASFFGAFEITMPSWLVNKADSKSDRGGIIGVFFMALTLVLVSFSCTGPIVGAVLIQSTTGAVWTPVLTMLAFSVAFALPFTLLALFPSMLDRLPRSGGWLNSVKVVLGFIELALALKFLSVADQTYHWGILDREVYLAFWIVIFTLLGFYLLGKLRFPHDSEVKHVGVTRLLLAIVTFSFVVYMLPGMWGAPLRGLSGYLPPLETQDFRPAETEHTVDSGARVDTGFPREVKYGDLLKLPHGLQGFFDLDEAMDYAKKVNKPLFVDYTGHGCVNCREMEARVWSDPQVLDLLRNDFVVVALYSDDKKQLPESDWITTEHGKVLKGMGKINAYRVHKLFGINAQPYYMILGADGVQLVPGRGYDLNVDRFVAFLQGGIQAYREAKRS